MDGGVIVWLGHLGFKRYCKPISRNIFAGAKCGPTAPPLPRHPCLHCKGAQLQLLLFKGGQSKICFAGEEESIWWWLRVSLILCCGKSTFRRFLLLLIQCPGSSICTLIFCPCSLIQCPCSYSLIFCPWALLQCPCPLIFNSLLPPANSQLQHPGGDAGGTGQSRKLTFELMTVRVKETNICPIKYMLKS